MKLKNLKPRLAPLPAKLPTITPGSWRADKQTSAQRGYGYQWQKAREAYLIDHPFCVYCLRGAGIEATETAAIIIACTEKRIGLPYASVVDHRTPHRGDQQLFWDRSNWQSLCAHHHSSDAQKRDRANQREGEEIFR